MAEVAEAVAAEPEGGTIVVDADAPAGLRVLFPAPTLYMMLRELAGNALRHAR